MKKKLLFLLSLPLLLVACEPNHTSSSGSSLSGDSSPSLSDSSTSSSSSSSLPLPTDIRSALEYLAKEKNYSFTIYEGGEPEPAYLFTYYFTEKVVGHTALDALEYTDLRIQDDTGVYPLNYYEDHLISGEYIRMEDGSLCQDVWEISDTLYGKSESFLSSLPSGETSLTITDKAYRLNLIKTLGYDNSAIVDLSSLEASFEGGQLSLSFTLGETDLLLVASDFGTTDVPLYDRFLSEGGDVYVPEETLAELRRLFATNQMIISQSSEQMTFRELLHPNYYFSCYEGSDMFSGYVAINKPEENIVGVYMAVGEGSFSADSVSGVTGIAVSTARPVWDVPDMMQFYRYPSAMLLWSNLQFLGEGLDENMALVVEGKGLTYHTDESTIVNDFVTNFSIDQSFPTDTYVPYSLSFDIQLDEEDRTSVVEIYYLYFYNNFTSAGYLHYSISGFGNTSLPKLDELIA